nr:TonB-dependent siderophore receptor [Burkholderia stagnalis]
MRFRHIGFLMTRDCKFRLHILSALMFGTGSLSLAHAETAPASPDAPTSDTQIPAGKGARQDSDRVRSLATVTVNGVRQQAPQVSSGALGTRSDLETPFSTRVVKQQELEDRQVKALGKVFAEDAAVMSLGDTYSFNAYSINVRGIALDDYNGYKINGLPFYMTTVELPVESFESIQLLKGSSGFMYGFGAPGGIINFVTKKPTDAFTFSADVGYSSDSVFSEHIDTGGRFGPGQMFGYRFNITHEQGDTYNGSHVLRNSESLSLDARLASGLTWTFDGIYQSRKVEGGIQDLTLDSYASKALPRAPSGRTNLSAYNDTWFNSNVYFASTGLHWQINPAWKASVDYSHSKDERSYSGQWLGLLNEQGDFNTFLNRARGSSIYDQVQATLEGKFSTGPVDHQVVVGASSQWLSKKTVPASLYTDIGANNLYQPIAAHTWNGTFDYGLQFDNFSSQQKSVFASDTLSFLKYWSILAGVRYTSYHQTSLTKPGAAAKVYTLTPTTPTFALMFRPRNDLLFYASYVEAIEDGGTAGPTYANANEVLSPLKSKQYEVGVKYDGRKVGASAALFRIQRGAEYGNAQNIYVSNGSERIEGLELNGRVDLPAGFRISASASWLSGTYTETEADLVGKRIEGIPRWQGVLQVSDRIPGLPGLTASAEAHYFGNMKADALNQYVLPSYTLFNAGLSYRTTIGGHGVTLRAEVDNIFNRRYWGFLQSDYIFVGQPRTVALNARFDL